MVEFIGQHVIAAAHQGGDDRQVGGVARSVGDGGFGVFEIRNRLFEFGVDRQRAGQRADAVRAGAELVHGFLGGFVDARMADQAQITVRSVHAHLTAVHAHLHPRQDLLHRLVVEIKIVRLQHRSALGECLNAASDRIVCILEIHARLLKRDCHIISEVDRERPREASHLMKWNKSFP